MAIETPDGITIPEPSPGDKSDGKDDAGRVFSEEEVNNKLRGKAKEVERATKALEAAQLKLAKLEEAAKKRTEEKLAADGKVQELAQLREQERDAALTELKQLRERETARVAVVDARNKERIKALPDALAKTLPKSADAYEIADLLTAIEGTLAEQQGQGVFGGSPKPIGKMTPENAIEAANQRLREIQADPFAARLAAKDRGVQR